MTTESELDEIDARLEYAHKKVLAKWKGIADKKREWASLFWLSLHARKCDECGDLMGWPGIPFHCTQRWDEDAQHHKYFEYCAACEHRIRKGFVPGAGLGFWEGRMFPEEP